MTEKFSQEVLDRIRPHSEDDEDPQDMAWAWFQTSEAHLEPHRNPDVDPDRIALLRAQFEKNPRLYWTSDCSECEWVMGGWLSKDNAAGALATHTEREHTAPPTKKKRK